MSVDLAVIGAGPAGMAAATLAADLGLDVVLFDEQQSPGGQIYRATGRAPLRHALGPEYARGQALVDALGASKARYVPGATVWNLDRARVLGVSVDGRSDLIEARQVVVATGAMERPMPIPGWTLPGVMTAGAAQIALKAHGLLPSGRIVLAGTGPLLWLLGWQLLRAGVVVDALLDTTPNENWADALKHLPSFLLSPLFPKGLALQVHLRRRIKVISGVETVEARGRDRLERVIYRRALHAEEEIDADLLLLHQGVVPNANLALAAGLAHEWSERQLAFLPVLDPWFGSSVDGIAVAGDGGGIGGALAAEERGRLAAIAAAHRLGRLDASGRDRLAGPVRSALARAENGRAFIDWLHRPSKAFRIPTGDTIVCRCEELRARDVADAIALGVQGPNQLKAFTRAGMGPCQGRLCGLTVTETIAAARGVGPGEVGYMRVRAPVRPITLGEYASLPIDETSRLAVER